MALASLGWLAVFGMSCAAPCPDPGCSGSLDVSVRGVLTGLVPKNAYEAVVCVDGDCVEATFTLPPTDHPCDALVRDGSLCCKTSWPAQSSLDCGALGADLELTVPLPKAKDKRRPRAVVLTVIDSEGDETVRDETRMLAADDSGCPNDCRHVRLGF